VEAVLESREETLTGLEFYTVHTYHSRPAILIENAENISLTDVTIHSQPGMGIVGNRSENITMRRLNVIPSVGHHMSTNTDATHFASCRGLLRLDGCEFEGQGDDSINVHTYYYTPERISSRSCRLSVDAPTGTHTQSIDHPEVGDTLELVNAKTLMPEDIFKVLEMTVDEKSRTALVTVDRDLPDSFEGYLICDPAEVPDVEFVNCHAHNHYARSILIKSRRALIENCTVTSVFDVAVKIAAEASWKEGINMEDVTIRGCRFIDNGCLNSQCGGISVTMDTEASCSMPQGRVVIENNIIDAPYSDFAIVIDRTREAIVKNNTLTSRVKPCVWVKSVETLLDCDCETYSPS
jgi:hypothetical protein